LIPKKDDIGIEDSLFWQVGEYDESTDLINRLEERAHAGREMRDFKLSRVDLCHVNLVNRNSKNGYRFIDCDFYRSNMSHSHCFMVVH